MIFGVAICDNCHDRRSQVNQLSKILFLPTERSNDNGPGAETVVACVCVSFSK